MNRAYRHILIATDFSEHAEAATRIGAALAHRFGARVTLLHVFDSGMYERAVSLKPADLEATMAQTSRDELERVAATTLADVEGVDCVPVRAVNPATAIMRHASRFGVDLVVVGTRGKGRLAKLFLGSVTEKIVRQAHCDVLVVRDDSPWPPAHIVAGTDFSAASAVALDRAAGLGAPMTVVHVFAHGAPLPPASMFEHTDEAVGRVQRELERWGSDWAAETTLRIGRSAGLELCRVAAERDAGLLVVGTHDRKGVAHLLVGSDAERVVRHAPCAVLVVRSTDSESEQEVRKGREYAAGTSRDFS